MEPGNADPVGQGAVMDIDPRPGEDLALAMQREVVGVGRPPSIRAAGALAIVLAPMAHDGSPCLTPLVRARQAYLGAR
jgi:hypothetical protein